LLESATLHILRELGLGDVRRNVSVMRRATTRPETNVSAAMTHMAAGNPNASAAMPASKAPTA
jgi:hypothetical protein